MRLFPPLLQQSLLNDRSFREKYCFKTDAIISFGPTNISFQLSVLFGAIREVLAGKAAGELTDTEDRNWYLTNCANEGARPNLVLSSDEQRLILPDFSVLSEDVPIRIRSLKESTSYENLPLNTQEYWRHILEERALEDDEVNAFNNDLWDTPDHVARTIQREIEEGDSSVSSLVPNSRRYFERLVGTYDGSNSIRDYAIGVSRKIFEQLTARHPYEGFLFSLLLSSHSALTAEINTDQLVPDELVKAFEYVEKHGDMLSRLGAFEVGLRILPARPEVRPFLLPLVQRIRDDNVEGNASEFKLLSALFVLVDGELARTRLLVTAPPFYRRLASLTQAALIYRQLVKAGIDYDHFSNWAFSTNFEHFYMQSLADMRTEPRWHPDLVDASQLQAEFFGRIMIAGSNFQDLLGDGDLRGTILGDGEQSLFKRYEFPRPYFPGPLEGTENCLITLPEYLTHVIEEQLSSDEIEAGSFITFVNSATIFKITSGHADLAAKALKMGNYNLANLKNKSQLLGILNGLATVAAVSRNSVLADELCILVRRYKHDSQYGFPIDEAMKILLVASSAREDLIEWRGFVGDWLTELAFGELKGNEGEIFHSHLLALLHSVPELWVSCAKADAALRAWNFH